MRGAISQCRSYWIGRLQPRALSHNTRGAVGASDHALRGRGSCGGEVWRRELNIFSVFSKEAREEEKSRLQDELNRGYFDDFRDMKKTGGKIAPASNSLAPLAASPKFPSLEVCIPKGDTLTLPGANADAALICVAFRASAQPMVVSWSAPFAETFRGVGVDGRGAVQVFEVSVIESAVLRLRPIKWLLLRTMRGSESGGGARELERKVVYAFGDTYDFRKVLGIPNLLSGYAFLVDRKGRVRWRASGMATEGELESMATCTTRLLQEESSKGGARG